MMDSQLTVITDQLPLDRNPAAVYLAGLANGSRRTMRGALDTIAGLLTGGGATARADALAMNWAALRFQHAAAIRSALAEKYSAASANKMLCALRGVLKAAWRLGLMASDDYTRAADVENVSGSTLPAGRALTAGEIAALLDVCMADPTAAGARDAAAIALLRVTGMRRAEMVALALADHNPADGSLIIRHGKGNRERLAYVTNGAAEALADWLHFRGNSEGPLFCPVSQVGRVTIAPISTESCYAMLQKRARQAGVQDVSPHDFRRTLVSDLLDAGADLSTVQRLAGHASVTTTARYDRRGEGAKKRAIELIHVPYRRRELQAEPVE